jgi:hypothetical protein
MGKERAVPVRDDRTTIIDEYSTWGEFLHDVANRVSPLPLSRRSAHNGDFSFTRTRSLKDALELGITGFAEGAEKGKKLATAIFDGVASMIERVEIVHDVEGNGLDVARYVDGEPECWQKFETIQLEGQGNKIIRLVFNNVASSGVSPEVMIRKGAAVSAVVELLEYAGHRVEVVSCCCVSGSAGKKLESWLTVKRSSEYVDAGRLAFALCHPSMLRRFYFAIWESSTQDTELLERMGIPDGGYGNCAEAPKEKRGDIYIGQSMYGERQWENDKAAETWVLDQLRNQGVHLREEKEVVSR